MAETLTPQIAELKRPLRCLASVSHMLQENVLEATTLFTVSLHTQTAHKKLWGIS